jgi:hypothetical protein
MSTKRERIVLGGRTYTYDDDGRAKELPGNPTPDVAVCRRLRDFALDKLPEGMAVDGCVRCGAAILFHPTTSPASALKVCMQCAGIEPLPLP